MMNYVWEILKLWFMLGISRVMVQNRKYVGWYMIFKRFISIWANMKYYLLSKTNRNKTYTNIETFDRHFDGKQIFFFPFSFAKKKNGFSLRFKL